MCLSASKWQGLGEDGWWIGKRQPGNSPQHSSLKPPLPHLTLCPGSPDKPTNTHTYTHISAFINAHTDRPRRTTSTPTRAHIHGRGELPPEKFATDTLLMVLYIILNACETVWLTVFVNICFPDGAGAGVTSLERAFGCCVTALSECVFV